MERIIKALTDRAPLAVTVLGVLVFVIGAVGGLQYQSFSLQVVDLGGRVALGLLGLLVSASGLLLLRQEMRNPINPHSRKRYGIQIERATQNHVEHGGFVEIVGSYRIKPPDKSLRLFVKADDRTRYWPKCVVERFDEGGKWSAQASLKTAKSGEPYGVYIVAALVGEAGEILWDYYYRVGHSKEVWEPLNPLPPDVIECDEVHVIKQS